MLLKHKNDLVSTTMSYNVTDPTTELMSYFIQEDQDKRHIEIYAFDLRFNYGKWIRDHSTNTDLSFYDKDVSFNRETMFSLGITLREELTQAIPFNVSYIYDTNKNIAKEVIEVNPSSPDASIKFSKLIASTYVVWENSFSFLHKTSDYLLELPETEDMLGMMIDFRLPTNEEYPNIDTLFGLDRVEFNRVYQVPEYQEFVLKNNNYVYDMSSVHQDTLKDIYVNTPSIEQDRGSKYRKVHTLVANKPYGKGTASKMWYTTHNNYKSN